MVGTTFISSLTNPPCIILRWTKSFIRFLYRVSKRP